MRVEFTETLQIKTCNWCARVYAILTDWPQRRMHGCPYCRGEFYDTQAMDRTRSQREINTLHSQLTRARNKLKKWKEEHTLGGRK